MLQIQSGVQQISFVAAFVVIGDFSDIIFPVLFSLRYSGVCIGVTALIQIFIVQREIQFGKKMARNLPPASLPSSTFSLLRAVFS